MSGPLSSSLRIDNIWYCKFPPCLCPSVCQCCFLCASPLLSHLLLHLICSSLVVSVCVYSFCLFLCWSVRCLCDVLLEVPCVSASVFYGMLIILNSRFCISDLNFVKLFYFATLFLVLEHIFFRSPGFCISQLFMKIKLTFCSPLYLASLSLYLGPPSISSINLTERGTSLHLNQENDALKFWCWFWLVVLFLRRWCDSFTLIE